MQVKNVIKDLAWKRSNGKMKRDKIKFLVIHHEGVATPSAYNTLKRIQADAAYHAYTKDWGHISYHFMMDNLGEVYQCLPEDEIGYHAGNLTVNKASIALCVQGNYQTQKLNAKQEKALAEFIKWMTSERPDLPLIVKSTVKLHQEVRVGSTSCPGKNLAAVVVKLRK